MLLEPRPRMKRQSYERERSRTSGFDARQPVRYFPRRTRRRNKHLWWGEHRHRDGLKGSRPLGEALHDKAWWFAVQFAVAASIAGFNS